MKLQVCPALFNVMTKIAITQEIFALVVLSTLFVTMDRINFGYSMKNIPIPRDEDVRMEIIHSGEVFIK